LSFLLLTNVFFIYLFMWNDIFVNEFYIYHCVQSNKFMKHKKNLNLYLCVIVKRYLCFVPYYSQMIFFIILSSKPCHFCRQVRRETPLWRRKHYIIIILIHQKLFSNIDWYRGKLFCSLLWTELIVLWDF